jgi:D-glycero-D-manno-heptose 1,7-bisphosphate phosphatase
MLYLFDLDDTLIAGYMARPDKAYAPVELLPNRAAIIAELRARGNDIALITNQAGVAFGHITEQDVIAKLGLVASALGFASIWLFDGGTHMRIGWEFPALVCHVCYSDARSKNAQYRTPADVARRKPSGQMIREAMGDSPEASALGVLFVGDREEDLQAAQDAGVAFQWAHIFFKDG